MNGVQLSYDITHGAFYTHAPYSYPMAIGHTRCSSMTKKGQKSLKNNFLTVLLPEHPMLPLILFYGPMKGVKLSYDITHCAV
jgi:hypothetical protein